VSDRYQKVTDDLTEDAENREKQLDAKLRIITSNVALQQEQLDELKTNLSHLNSSIESIKTVDFSHNSNQVQTLSQFKDSFKEFNVSRFMKDYKIILESNNSVHGNLTKVQAITTELDVRTSDIQENVESYLERIRKRSQLYDANFRKLNNQPILQLKLDIGYNDTTIVISKYKHGLIWPSNKLRPRRVC